MCPLCLSTHIQSLPKASDGQRYYLCEVCDLRFLDKSQHLESDSEKQRYCTHRTHLADGGYRKFVSGLLDSVQKHVPKGGRILDFGAGHQPVLAQWMRDLGFEVEVYDPFFWPQAPTGLFDAVVSCEVIEHFFDPAAEFTHLSSLIKPKGHLLAMTDIYQPSVDFLSWYYRRDPTHVVFYSEKTLRWIGSRFGFARTEIRGRVVHFFQDC